ncbi:MAG: HesA/MoeB/ThiF family protein [Deltaproteobacteria bacterium]|nr:HesA/MoeB/ThiF family protein [Deltaproteobacteria bacterium]
MTFKRFERQIQIPEIGIEGQRKIKRAKVLLVGVGGLGSPVAYYLAAAGVGRIGIADGDRVEMTNLNRQFLHTPERIGMLKVESAEQTIRTFNPETKVFVYPERLSSVDEAIRIIKGYDVIIDCCDNYPTRFTLNTACIQTRKPLIYGAVSGFEGQVMTIIPGKGPCYQCLYPSSPPPSEVHNSSGVIGVSPGMVGCIQATEALKYILGVGALLVGRLLFVDLLEMTFSLLAVGRNKSCPACANEYC